MSQLVRARVTGREEPAPGFHLLEFYAPSLARAAQPGQFVHIRCGEGTDPLLRRPISIHAVDRRDGLVRVLFRVVGRGTALLARRGEDSIDVMGPLGRGFSRGQAYRNCNNSPKNDTIGPGTTGGIIVVGGGIGVAPLHFLLQEIARSGDSGRTTVLLGARCAGELLICDAAEKMGFAVRVATDDGSAGHHGPVTHLLAGALGTKPGFVYACGPAPMLKAVCDLLAEAGVPGEVSVEERMACGVGACLSCACRVRDAGGRETYRRACVDGPVFPAGKVVWP